MKKLNLNREYRKRLDSAIENPEIEQSLTNGESHVMHSIIESEKGEFDTLVFGLKGSTFWENAIPDMCQALKSTGLHTFVFVNTQAGMIGALYDFLEYGFKVVGPKAIKIGVCYDGTDILVKGIELSVPKM